MRGEPITVRWKTDKYTGSSETSRVSPEGRSVSLAVRHLFFFVTGLSTCVPLFLETLLDVVVVVSQLIEFSQLSQHRRVGQGVGGWHSLH